MKPRFYLIPIAIGLALAVSLYLFLKSHRTDIGAPTAAPAAPPPASLPPRSIAEIPTPEIARLLQSDPAPLKVDPLTELKRRLDDPSQHTAHLARARLKVEQNYSRLFQRLRNLPPEVLDQLKTALAEKQLALERGALPDRLPVSDAEAKTGKARLDRIQQETDAQLRAVFGDEVYAQYNYVQQSEPLRGSIEQVTNLMRSRGVDVTEEMQENILAGYTSALVAAATVSASDTTPEAFQALSEAARQELRAKQQSRFDEALASTMSKILSPDDYKLFMESEFAYDAGSP
jgi:hypothetical protein